MKKIISIAKNFSVRPGGRTKKDGPYSGEEFLEQFLVPAMDQGIPFVVDLNGTKGYGSSFLDEAFGGLVRKDYDVADIKRLMEVVAADKSLRDEIWLYINEESGMVHSK